MDKVLFLFQCSVSKQEISKLDTHAYMYVLILYMHIKYDNLTD